MLTQNEIAMDCVIDELKAQLLMRKKVQKWLAAVEEPYEFSHLDNVTMKSNTPSHYLSFQEQRKLGPQKMNSHLQNGNLSEEGDFPSFLERRQHLRKPKRLIPVHQNEELVYRRFYFDKPEEKKSSLKKFKHNIKKGIRFFKEALKETFCSCYGF